ncbi:hypothetical protein [Selenomonas sp. KH1T6]|uniref:hypothetical protein n=1 Tax=Selenomonas sp. KH1T6 TaxID=3158784 RepID=UPI0008A7EDFA|nr:hypothetical protein SAMN05216583_1124 [Selenomonas ruminantium]
MKRKEEHICAACGKGPLSKDETGISKKLLDDDVFYCLDCLSAYFEVDVQDLLDKIEEFKEQGCTLFA